MYGYLCQHYKVDPSVGLTWNTALAIWKESNPPPKNTNSKSSKTPAPPSKAGGSGNNHGNNKISKSKSPQPGSNVSFASNTNGGGHGGSHGGNSGFGGLTRSKTDRTSRMSRTNLGDFTKDNNNARTRSPSPGGTIRGHTRDKSLSNSMSSKTRSYRNGAIGTGSSVSGGTSSNIGMLQPDNNNLQSSMQHSTHGSHHVAHTQSMYNLSGLGGYRNNTIATIDNIDTNSVAAQIQQNATVIYDDLPPQGQGLSMNSFNSTINNSIGLPRQLSRSTMSKSNTNTTNTNTLTLTNNSSGSNHSHGRNNSGSDPGLAALVDSYLFFLLLFFCVCCLCSFVVLFFVVFFGFLNFSLVVVFFICFLVFSFAFFFLFFVR